MGNVVTPLFDSFKMQRYDFVSTQEIEARVKQGTPVATQRSTNFALHVYEQWQEARTRAHPNWTIALASPFVPPCCEFGLVAGSLCDTHAVILE